MPEKTTVPSNITVSPDGLRVVFAANNAEGKRELWMRSLDADKAQPLAGTDGAVSPFWSPDSRFVGYFANEKLFKVDALGGRPQLLCEVREEAGGAWNRDASNQLRFTGRIYRTKGCPWQLPFDPAATTFSTVGTADFTPLDASHGIFSYTVDGVEGSKMVERFRF